MKKIKFMLALLLSVFSGFEIVFASSDDFTLVSSESAFDECLESEGACRLTADLTVTGRKEISSDAIIDLNGQVIQPDANLKLKNGLITVNRGAKLVINDSKGTGKITTGSGDNVWGAVQLVKDNTSNEPAELIINGGTIEGYYYGVVGNGTLHNTRITINEGIIKGLNTEDSVGVYHPQDGQLIVNGGEISGGTGIEIRSGSLTLNNGTVSGVASNFVKAVNGSGSTTNGVGIAVAQHTTKKPISVVIKGGNIKGQYAFYEWNPHRNNQDALSKISLSINGGNFEGYAQGVSTIYSEDFTNFVTGGTFNKNVDKYLTADASVFKSEDNDEEKNNKSFKWIILVGVLVIVAGGILGFVLWCKVR